MVIGSLTPALPTSSRDISSAFGYAARPAQPKETRPMSEASSGLSLVSNGDDFILSQTGDDGVTARIALSAADILALTRSALALREKRLAASQPASGEMEAVLASPVTEAEIAREALGDHVLLTLTSPEGDRASFALPLGLAAELSARLADLVAETPPTPPSRQ
jgi:hypothetical protein